MRHDPMTHHSRRLTLAKRERSKQLLLALGK
jgi:hypothetical protein